MTAHSKCYACQQVAPHHAEDCRAAAIDHEPAPPRAGDAPDHEAAKSYAEYALQPHHDPRDFNASDLTLARAYLANAERLRLVCQMLVAEVGAAGPCNAEEAATRAVERLRPLSSRAAEPVAWAIVDANGGVIDMTLSPAFKDAPQSVLDERYAGPSPHRVAPLYLAAPPVAPGPSEGDRNRDLRDAAIAGARDFADSLMDAYGSDVAGMSIAGEPIVAVHWRAWGQGQLRSHPSVSGTPERGEGVREAEYPRGVVVRARDDNNAGTLMGIIDEDGDAHLTIISDGPGQSVEFCTNRGGGRNPEFTAIVRRFIYDISRAALSGSPAQEGK